MKKFFGLILLYVWAPVAFAISPYIMADKVTGGDIKTAMTQVEKKLEGEGFTVVGRHLPKGLAPY